MTQSGRRQQRSSVVTFDLAAKGSRTTKSAPADESQPSWPMVRQHVEPRARVRAVQLALARPVVRSPCSCEPCRDLTGIECCIDDGPEVTAGVRHLTVGGSAGDV